MSQAGLQLKVRLFRYKGSSFAKLSGIDGGTPAQVKFLHDYIETIARFKTPISPNPVILVVDQDSGGKKMYDEAIKVNSGVQPFANVCSHIAHNVYVVCVPLVAGAESAIEDLHQSRTLRTILNGKTFSKKNDLDTIAHYGKVAFSQFVKKNCTSIDFSGFDGLLSRITQAIKP